MAGNYEIHRLKGLEEYLKSGRPSEIVGGTLLDNFLKAFFDFHGGAFTANAQKNMAVAFSCWTTKKHGYTGNVSSPVSIEMHSETGNLNMHVMETRVAVTTLNISQL